MAKYEVDKKLSGKIELSTEEHYKFSEMLKYLIAGKQLLADEEYIKSSDLSDEDLNEIRDILKSYELFYFEILDSIEELNTDDEEIPMMTLSIDSEGNLGIIVLKDITTNNKQDLLKMIGCNIYCEGDKVFAEF